jgi:hypothetical protein
MGVRQGPVKPRSILHAVREPSHASPQNE